MHRQIINFRVSCSTSFFATNTSQFSNFLAVPCQIFLKEPISQFQFSIQANFCLSEPDLPVDFLVTAEIAEFQKFLIDLSKSNFRISLFPISRLNRSLLTIAQHFDLDLSFLLIQI